MCTYLICIAQDYVLKLADMGEARLISSAPKRNVPPIPARNWAPPEVGLDLGTIIAVFG